MPRRTSSRALISFSFTSSAFSAPRFRPASNSPPSSSIVVLKRAVGGLGDSGIRRMGWSGGVVLGRAAWALS